MSMFSAEIVPMAERQYRMVPLEEIEVLNSRNRERRQFDDNVRSIKSVGLLKPIVVNERNRNRTGRYELVCGEGRFRDQEGEPAMVFMEDLEERSRSGSGQDS